ncbi:MAG: PHP domain-containing protein [Rikenellaceae bacterium]|nr:PHP domain-containing protein [Rikenellaceae bacterium]
MLKADLHIHSVLSPCGDIEMSPAFLIRRAQELSIGIIGITDHNSTRQCAEIRRIGKREGVYVLCGAEVTTREEVHVLVFADFGEPLARLQAYLDRHLPSMPNHPELFGYQLAVNEEEEVVYEEERLLIHAIDRSLEELEAFCRSIGGIFIPAHIDKTQNSLLSQLGFIPEHLHPDALEVSHRCNPEVFRKEHPPLADHRLIRSSDAHYPQEVGRATVLLDVETPSFRSVKQAIL